MKKRLLGIHIGREAYNFSATTSDERNQQLEKSWKIQSHKKFMTGCSSCGILHSHQIHKQETNAVELFIWQIILCVCDDSIEIHLIPNPYLKIIELRKSGFIIKYKRPILTYFQNSRDSRIYIYYILACNFCQMMSSCYLDIKL